MSGGIVVPRRAFLVGLGLAAGTLALGFDVEVACAEASFSPNAFVHVAPDGTVTIACQRSEMGQGVRSSIPALIADEMGADWARVKIVQADGDPAYGDQSTDGSKSIRGQYDSLRRLGATARVMLVDAAAKRWGVPASACVARDHAVVHLASKRALGFGPLAVEAAKLPVPKGAPLRPKGELRRVGGALPMVDAPDIVTGRARYGADTRLPGMLFAVVARPPVVGGRVARYDAKRALAVPGVRRVVELPVPPMPPGFSPLGGLAVVADTTWAAMRGRAALDVSWRDGDNASYESGAYRDALAAVVRAPGRVVRRKGDVDAALASAARRVEAEYHVPHLAHASMEPPCAVARFEGGRCEVWSPTQDPQEARRQLAKALGIPEASVTVHVTLLGGAFGRKAKPDYDVEAALVSRAVGAPVLLQWTREDDVRHDFYHSTSAQRLVAGLDPQGRTAAWLHRTAFPSISATFRPGVTHASDGELGQGLLDFPLAVPNVRAENGEAVAHVRIGWLRSVINIHHGFAIGSFIDEIAHARGADPRDTWLELLGPPRVIASPDELGVDKVPNYGTPLSEQPVDVGRLRHVIERVTEMAGWSEGRRSGRALGLAAHRSFLSYVAVVASAVLDPRGKVRIDEAWIACDAGTIVNAERVRAQLEGAFVFGMSAALHGAITMKRGAVEQSNFRDYRLVRMPRAPRAIHVDIVASDAPSGGVGEPGVPPVAPAIANAVFACTGKRIRELPLERAGLV